MFKSKSRKNLLLLYNKNKGEKKMRKAATVIMCSIMATSCLPVHADSLGSISMKSDIECEFSGEIYIIISDKDDNRKLAVLNSNNNYEFKLNNLNSGSYDIAEVHVYNTNDQYSADRKEISSANFTLEYDNLNINENNQSPAVLLKLHSLEKEKKEKENKENINKTDTDLEDNTYIDESDQIEQSKEKEKEEEEEGKKSLERRKKIYFINFVIDGLLILGLGAIWFFKIRKRNGKKDDIDG